MSVTDQLLKNADAYAAAFDKGDLSLAPGSPGCRAHLIEPVHPRQVECAGLCL